MSESERGPELYDVKQSATATKDEAPGERVARAAREHRVPLVVAGALAAGFVTGRLTGR